MTEAMPFLQKFDITFLRPPTIMGWFIVIESRDLADLFDRDVFRFHKYKTV